MFLEIFIKSNYLSLEISLLFKKYLKSKFCGSFMCIQSIDNSQIFSTIYWCPSEFKFYW